MRRRLSIFSIFAMMLVFFLLFSGCTMEKQHLQPSLVSFSSRMPLLHDELTEIIRSAETAAKRTIAHPQALLNIPYEPQVSFSRDLLNRSGGLVRIHPSEWRKEQISKNDIVLFSVRSWESDGKQAKKLLEKYRESGWMVILFASKSGMPDSVDFDYLIDNGARSSSKEEAHVNSLINITNGWIWCCEYFAALTRHEKYPPIFLTHGCSNGPEFNKPLRGDRLQLLECGTPVPRGKLGKIYLKRIERLIRDLSSHKRQIQIRQAAEIISERLRCERKVFVSAQTHFLEAMGGELFTSSHSAWQPFVAGKDSFKKYLKKGDLLVWISEALPNPCHCWHLEILETEADVITSHLYPIKAHPDIPDWTHQFNPEKIMGFYPNSLAHIDQNWFLGDVEVPIPVPPGAMAPISSINSGLIYRILDDAVAERMN